MNDAARLDPIKDLVDFYNRWPAIRPRIQAVSEGAPPTADDLEILNWLIRITDMIGPSDLGWTED